MKTLPLEQAQFRPEFSLRVRRVLPQTSRTKYGRFVNAPVQASTSKQAIYRPSLVAFFTNSKSYAPRQSTDLS
jgi:hypothetical protein